MTDFQPINLCNVLYKIIAKVLANWLKMFLPNLISPTQSPFVPRRLISDNILVAYELTHFPNHKQQGHDGFMSLKLDISLAYDRVE